MYIALSVWNYLLIKAHHLFDDDTRKGVEPLADALKHHHTQGNAEAGVDDREGLASRCIGRRVAVSCGGTYEVLMLPLEVCSNGSVAKLHLTLKYIK